MLIINRMEIDKIENIILLNSIILMIIINDKDVLLGDKFMNKIFKLLFMENIIINIHNIRDKFNVNVIWWEFEYIIGNRLIKLIIKII